MPAIPIPRTAVGAQIDRVPGNRINVSADPSAYGAGTGAALQNVGQAVGNVGNALAAEDNRKRAEAVAAAVAQSDFSPVELGIRNTVDANASGYHDTVLNAYDQYVTDNADKIDDDRTRAEYTRRMMAERPNIASSAASYQAATAATNSNAQAGAALDTLNVRIAQNPTQFDSLVQQGNAVIDARPDLNATLKSSMKQSWGQDSANNRFEGMLEAANTPADVDNIAAELADQKADWASKFDPAKYEALVNKLGVAKREMQTQADVQARAALDTLDDRNKGLALIPPDEMSAVQTQVKASNNPVTQMRMARIVRDQELIATNRTLPPSQVQSQINQINQNPGAAYPGVPTRVSNAINAASSTFGVSASYLGATAQREYGGNFKRQSSGNPQFTPHALSANVDLRDVRPEVLDAATVAGQSFGSPLNIISGERSQEQQDAIRFAGDPNRPGVAKVSQHTSGNALDISIAGMSDNDKGRLVSSLVDAGFTGIGEYDTHIHADMRNAVPGSYGVENGKPWGGWTYLSPAVAEALRTHGYAAGATSDQIKRASPVATEASVDYSKANAATSATGVMQFTNDTFLGLMKDGKTAQRMGIDVSSMSDNDILALRKNPDVSIMAAAALGEKNKAVLGEALGRPISDAELYMAHFLGTGGAITLLKNVRDNPNADVTKLLPVAAENNKNVFYDGSKPKTAQQLYNDISTSFVASPSQVSYGDTQTLQNIHDASVKGLKDDPVAFAQSSGAFNVVPLSDPNGFAARGQSARAIADYYSIPISDMKPLTDDEANTVVKSMDSGQTADVMAVLQKIDQMGGDVAKAAFAQIGDKDPVYGQAAGLYNNGNADAAAQVVQGEKSIKENTAIKDQIGASPTDIASVFNSTVGGALSLVSPTDRQAIQDAAYAHYAAAVANGSANAFDKGKFVDSVQAVMGGAQGSPSVDNVNGQPTVLPKGISAPVMDSALNKMTNNDWITLSPQKQPPRDNAGSIIPAQTLADEAALRYLGGGQYRVMLGDGGYAIVSPGQAYIFQPDPKTITQIAARPTTGQSISDLYGGSTRGDMKPSQIWGGNSASGNPYTGHLDESGRWVQN